MRALLDTTYLLPAIGISIKGLPGDALIKLLRGEHEVSISDITIFELLAKGARQVISGNLGEERVSRGVRAIVYDERIERIPIHDGLVQLTAFKLRRMLDDFIDCLILSSAVHRNDILVTEDLDIQKIMEKRDFKELLLTINSRFEVQTAKGFI